MSNNRGMMSGKMILPKQGKPDILFLVEQISKLDLDEVSKDILLIASYTPGCTGDKVLIRRLSIIIERKSISSRESNNDIISEKIAKLDSIDEQELVKITSELITKIENKEISVFGCDY